MKFSKEDYYSLKTAISDTLKWKHKTVEQLRDQYVSNGLTRTRLLWDLYWTSGAGDNETFRKYYDAHINTALERIYNELLKPTY